MPTTADRRLVLRDYDHPDFPHGTPKGYSRECPCDPCRAAYLRNAKEYRLRAATGRQTPKTVDQHTYDRFAAHVATLHGSNPLMTYGAISTAAGFSYHAVVNALHDKSAGPALAKAVLAMTPADLEHVELRRVPRQPVVAAIRKMQALGYPSTWQAKQLGFRIKDILANRRIESDSLRRDIAEPILALAARVGDTPADAARDGMTPSTITGARNDARAAGFYPPACYDDDGDLNLRAIPDHPWARADDYAHDKIRDLRIITARNSDEQQHLMARALGLDSAEHMPTHSASKEVRDANPALFTATETLRRSLERTREATGTRSTDAGRDARLDALRREWVAYENGSGEDPVAFALRLGLASEGHTALKNKEAQDHPGLLEYREWVAEQQDEAA